MYFLYIYPIGTFYYWRYNTLMDTNSLIAIIIGVIAIYFFVKLVVGPIIKAVIGIVIFLVAAYLLQRYLNFDLLGTIGIAINKWLPGFSWILEPIGYYINKVKILLNI